MVAAHCKPDLNPGILTLFVFFVGVIAAGMVVAGFAALIGYYVAASPAWFRLSSQILHTLGHFRGAHLHSQLFSDLTKARRREGKPMVPQEVATKSPDCCGENADSGTDSGSAEDDDELNAGA